MDYSFSASEREIIAKALNTKGENIVTGPRGCINNKTHYLLPDKDLIPMLEERGLQLDAVLAETVSSGDVPEMPTPPAKRSDDTTDHGDCPCSHHGDGH